jgi:hypothetical protein
MSFQFATELFFLPMGLSIKIVPSIRGQNYLRIPCIIHLFTFSFLCLFIYLSIHPSIHPCILLSIISSVCSSIHSSFPTSSIYPLLAAYQTLCSRLGIHWRTIWKLFPKELQIQRKGQLHNPCISSTPPIFRCWDQPTDAKMLSSGRFLRN